MANGMQNSKKKTEQQQLLRRLHLQMKAEQQQVRSHLKNIFDDARTDL